MDKLPQHLKELMHDRSVSMSKKMTAVAMFLPNPDPTENAKSIHLENEKLGETLVKLIKQNKLRFEKLDSDFNLKVTQL